MRYVFSQEEKAVLAKLTIPFDPLGNLSDDQESQLLEILSEHYGTVAYEAEGDIIGGILTHMAQQAK